MIYEVYDPGDGSLYPFVWAWAKDIKNRPIGTDGTIYLSLSNSRFCSGFVNPTMTAIHLATEIFKCGVEQAMAIKTFMESKYNDLDTGPHKTNDDKREDSSLMGSAESLQPYRPVTGTCPGRSVTDDDSNDG
jgi:hypothetical protein